MDKRHYTEIAPPVLLGQTYLYNKAWSKGDLRIWITRDLYKSGELRYHMSISTATRYPVWDEIRDAWYALTPDKTVTMAMMLPPQSEYVNLHPNCFHLHEVIE